MTISLATGLPTRSDGTKRSLILAGGGMRVAYQAGVLRALGEEDLSFNHMDGTSGGTINLAMLLSGLNPEAMCEKWRTLDIKQFASIAPTNGSITPDFGLALGTAHGIENYVFPHLGINIEKVQQATGMQATFNVCNFTHKTNEVISHEHLELPLLTAGISLPIFMPPVEFDGCLYVDSVWIKDANLSEAVRQGADEIWLVWCIGNSPEYKHGFFNQYVHMIELSANGVLFEELARIQELNESEDRPGGRKNPIVLHCIKPEIPLPLDPDLYLDKIDTSTLIAMGYADAKRYLQGRSQNGVPLDYTATSMKDGRPGLLFREVMRGEITMGSLEPDKSGKASGGITNLLEMHATIIIEDIDTFVADQKHTGRIVGHINFDPIGTGIPASEGVFNLFSPTEQPGHKYMVYEMGFSHQGKEYYLAGHKDVHDDPGFDLWKDTTTLFTKLYEGKDATGPVIGAGILSLSLADLLRLTSTLHPLYCHSVAEGAASLAKFGRMFLGELWDSYKPHGLG